MTFVHTEATAIKIAHDTYRFHTCLTKWLKCTVVFIFRIISWLVWVLQRTRLKFEFQITILVKLLYSLTTHLVAHVQPWKNDHREGCGSKMIHSQIRYIHLSSFGSCLFVNGREWDSNNSATASLPSSWNPACFARIAISLHQDMNFAATVYYCCWKCFPEFTSYSHTV